MEGWILHRARTFCWQYIEKWGLVQELWACVCVISSHSTICCSSLASLNMWSFLISLSVAPTVSHPESWVKGHYGPFSSPFIVRLSLVHTNSTSVSECRRAHHHLCISLNVKSLQSRFVSVCFVSQLFFHPSAFFCAPVFVTLHTENSSLVIVLLHLIMCFCSNSRRKVFGDLPVFGQGWGWDWPRERHGCRSYSEEFGRLVEDQVIETPYIL